MTLMTIGRGIEDPRSTEAKGSKTEMMGRWELVFPHRNYVSWHFGPRILICVLFSHILVPMKLILRSLVLPEELLKWMEMDHGGGIRHGKKGIKPATSSYQCHLESNHLRVHRVRHSRGLL